MLEFKIEWESAPGVATKALQATWARLEIRANGQLCSRYYSEQTQGVRDGVYGSLLPLARFVVENWWSLVAEGIPDPAVLKGAHALPGRLREWAMRHNLSLGREGMAYPDLVIFREDDRVGLRWLPDPNERATPGRFLDEGSTFITVAELEEGLDRLVESVLQHLASTKDDEVDDLNERWSAIRTSRRRERRLCERLACLGLDPYDPEADLDVEASLTSVEFDEHVVRDVCAVAKPTTLKQHLAAVDRLLHALPKATKGVVSSVPAGPDVQPHVFPYRTGYRRAESLRARLELSADEPIADIHGLIKQVLGASREKWVAPYSTAIEGLVQTNGAQTLVATKRSPRGTRFLLARALHHWLFATTCEAPQRLLTTSSDWQQAASRAFAAELLAPATAIETRLSGSLDPESLEALVDEFNVDALVIAHQVHNRLE